MTAKKPIIFYVAGPYRPQSAFQSLPIIRWFYILRNILRARRLSIWLWKNGDIAICPHLNTAFFDLHDIPDRVFLQGDIAILKRCDAIVMLDGWQKSIGASSEHCIAVFNGTPIYYWTGHTLYRKEC